MLILLKVIDDNEEVTTTRDVILQTENIVSVVEAYNATGNCVILYKEHRKLVEYEIGMEVGEFYKYLQKYLKNNLLQ